MDWFYADSGTQAGPVDDAGLVQLVNEGRIRADTLVWHPGLANWQPYAVIQRGSRCAECAREYAPDDLAAFGDRLICAACKPSYAQKLREGLITSERMPFGGFWIRFGAILIDGIILYLVGFIVSGFGLGVSGFRLTPSNSVRLLQVEGVVLLVQILIGITYETFFVGKFGATPGKMACHLRVVRSGGSKLTYRRAAARYGAKMISSFTLSIGFVIAAFDDEKRALHDHICDTRVIRV